MEKPTLIGILIFALLTTLLFAAPYIAEMAHHTNNNPGCTNGRGWPCMP